MVFIHARDRTLLTYSTGVFALWACTLWVIVSGAPLIVCIVMHLLMFEANIQLARWIFNSAQVKSISQNAKKLYAPSEKLLRKSLKNQRNSFAFSLVFAVFPMMPSLISGQRDTSFFTVILGYLVAYFSFNIYVFLRASQNAAPEQLRRIEFK